MTKVYINSKNLETILKKIENNEPIVGIEYNFFKKTYKTYHSLYSLKRDDVIALCRLENNILQPYEWVKWDGITLEKRL
jgi:hypothetical protein